MKKYFNIINIRLVLIFIMVLFLYSFTAARNAKRKLQNSEVIFVGENNNLLTVSWFTKLVFSPTKTTSDLCNFRFAFRAEVKAYKNSTTIKISTNRMLIMLKYFFILMHFLLMELKRQYRPRRL